MIFPPTSQIPHLSLSSLTFLKAVSCSSTGAKGYLVHCVIFSLINLKTTCEETPLKLQERFITHKSYKVETGYQPWFRHTVGL